MRALRSYREAPSQFIELPEVRDQSLRTETLPKMKAVGNQIDVFLDWREDGDNHDIRLEHSRSHSTRIRMTWHPVVGEGVADVVPGLSFRRLDCRENLQVAKPPNWRPNNRMNYRPKQTCWLYIVQLRQQQAQLLARR